MKICFHVPTGISAAFPIVRTIVSGKVRHIVPSYEKSADLLYFYSQQKLYYDLATGVLNNFSLKVRLQQCQHCLYRFLITNKTYTFILNSNLFVIVALFAVVSGKIELKCSFLVLVLMKALVYDSHFKYNVHKKYFLPLVMKYIIQHVFCQNRN